MLWNIEGEGRRERQRMRWLDSITDSVDMDSRNSRRHWRIEEPDVLQSLGSQSVRHDLVTEQRHAAHQTYHLAPNTTTEYKWFSFNEELF